MTTSVKKLIKAANTTVPRTTPAQASQMIVDGNTLVFDMRAAPELEGIEGAHSGPD